MDNKTPKPRLNKQPNPVFHRPPVKKERTTALALKDKFDQQILEKHPWGQFLLFLEDLYTKTIPRLHEEDKSRGTIFQEAIKLLNQYPQESWSQLINRFSPSDYKDVDDIYYHISNRKKLTPQQVHQESQAAIKGLINNAEYGFIYTENRDIGRISQLCDAINYFQKHRSKTYLILAQLEANVPEDAKTIFAASPVFQKIIEFGITEKLEDFGMALMKHFKVTRTAIKDEAASNLVLSMGEIERELRTQINILEAEKLDLTKKLAETHQQAHQESLTEIAKALQNGTQPALDQIQKIIKLLQSQLEETGEPELTSDDALSIFIILRNFMEVLQQLGIESYPKSVKGSFKISQIDLRKYAYIGNPFSDETEIKEVECIQTGWKVNNTVITPAQIKELTPTSENH
ncbi:hypothetical protein [Nodularia chucula]|uniref:hypothetical protein n=1 Tax=Nodularia chucula TaxID=3093667 RepID=UPI0039C67D0E